MAKERAVRTSKFLSLVLRHEPGLIGITLDEAGWVEVSELLRGCRAHGRPLTLDELREVVAANDKRRFSFSEDGRKIRANQGHSVPVDLGYSPAEPPAALYHGTADKFLPRIREQGLKKGARHHVHLSPDSETARRVGGRRGRPVVLRVESGRMSREGYEFFLSANGVWLTERVPPEYITFTGAKEERMGQGERVRAFRWEEMPKEFVVEGIERRLVTGERMMLAHIYLKKGAVVPRHSHDNEQLTYILEGALRFWVGEDESEVMDVRAGGVLLIPSNVPHRAEALEDTLDVDVFSPPRQDWLDKTDDYFRRK